MNGFIMSLSVVILAAGKGTRMRSSLPKVLHSVADKPMVGHVIDSARQLGASNIYVVYGFGGEVGYRWLPSTEFRLTYSQFDLTSEYEGIEEPDGASTAVDVLYFPTEQNLYLLTGVNNLDIGNSQISGNLGAGYRYFLGERSAIYLESKLNYQFSERYDELTTQIGFVYFFGDNKSSALTEEKVVAPLDTDKDGVYDIKDQCPATPMTDKVDHLGCTIFIENVTTIQLLVKFDHNKAVIKPEFNAEIKVMADFLKANPALSLTIEGHASSVGSHAYNLTLSQKRADAIVNKLISSHQIEANRLTAVGYGEERLINLENTLFAHGENRRIMAKVEVKKRAPVKR